MTKHYIDEIPFGVADKPGYTVDKGFLRDLKTFKRSMISIDLMKISRSSWE